MYENDFKQLDSDYYGIDYFSNEEDMDVMLAKGDNLPRLRQISDWLMRNSFIAPGMRKAITDYTVGSHLVIKPMFRKKIHKGLARRLKRDMKRVDLDRGKSITQVLVDIFSAAFTGGDCILNTSADPDSDSRYAQSFLEVVTAKRIASPPSKVNDSNVVHGIVRSKTTGKITGAYIRKVQNPNIQRLLIDEDDSFTFLPFYQYDTDSNGVTTRRQTAMLVSYPINSEPTQTRQTPPIQSIMALIRYYEDYLNTTLIGKKVSNAFAGFITATDKAGTMDNLQAMTPNTRNLPNRGNIRPGTLPVLNKGETINFGQPKSASEGDDLLQRRILQLMSFPIGFPYEIMFRDLANVNYNSWKSGELTMDKSLSALIELRDAIITFVLNTWQYEYHKKGFTTLSPDDIETIHSMPGSAILDKEKDGRGDKLNLTNKTKSVHDVHDENGTNYETTLAERKQEALDEVGIDTDVLVLKKKNAELFGIEFPEDKTESRTTAKRDGESTLDEDDARERRKEDGNA